MTGWRRCLGALVAVAAPAAAGDLGLVKSAAVVTDGIGPVAPKALPGARIDYRLTVTNPLTGLLSAATGETVADVVDPAVKLSVVDLGAAGSGPVAFEDGSLLGTGLAASGLSYSYGGLSSMTDALEFYNGTSWSYVPVPDADGCDGQVRAIRVRLSGAQAGATSYRLRYRVVVR